MPKGYPKNRAEALVKRSASLKIDPIIRFCRKIGFDDNGCWIWTAPLAPDHYPQIKVDGRFVYAHCFSYEYFRGPIPHGYEVDHLCRNKSCVSPWHLEPVTPAVNCQRAGNGGYNKVKTHCPRGHPYDEENTYRSPGRAHRVCRICMKEANRRWKKNQRESRGMTSQAQAG